MVRAQHACERRSDDHLHLHVGHIAVLLHGALRIVAVALDRVVLAHCASNPPDTGSWHSELTYKDEPPFATILVARDVPSSGGDTLWTNMYAAYEALPDEMRCYLRGLRAVHEMESFRNNITIDAVADNSALANSWWRRCSALGRRCITCCKRIL